MGEMIKIINDNRISTGVAVILFFLVLHFLWRFFIRQFSLKEELKNAIKALGVLEGKNPTELHEIKSKAMQKGALPHLWAEFEKTLHAEKKDTTIVKWRSTALAETFFTEQAIVDSRLQTDYFKHLPGILTGLGIIGTFAGLIGGLVNFKVTVDPIQSQEQLQGLVHSVGHAFYVSAAAICAAMLITWIEKICVSARYSQVEKLREGIDSLFTSGAGEEYLERLVTASETSATQALQLKDALVTDLKEILSTLTTQQIEAQKQHTGQMSVDMGKAIADALSEPMSKITNAVQSVSGNQGDAIHKMLTDVLVSFQTEMREMFGNQMAGVTTLMQEASANMKNAAMQFGQLAANMDAAGTNTVDAMGEKLTQALDAMEARQAAMNGHMGAFVEQIRGLVAQSQTETNDKLRESLAAIGTQVAGVVDQLRQQAEASAQSQGERGRRLEESTHQAIGSLSGQVEQLLKASMETSQSLQTTVASLANATNKAITDMNSGAQTLYLASSDFAKAGQGVTNTLQASTAATEAIHGSAKQLTQATDSAKAVITDYAKTRDTFATMVMELKLTIETAKREASMTAGIVTQMEAASTQLVQAQKHSEDYLVGLNKVLVEAHDKFALAISDTLRTGNSQFHEELSSAVGLLSGAIKNLGDVVDDIPVKR